LGRTVRLGDLVSPQTKSVAQVACGLAGQCITFRTYRGLMSYSKGCNVPSFTISAFGA
jgi:hypothetical protein